MVVSSEMITKLNELLSSCFDMNGHSDNVAYWLRFNNYVEATNEFHEKYAHKFPVFADQITEFMAKIKSRPVRMAFPEHVNDYPGTEEAFADVNDHMLKFIDKIEDCIELAEMNGEGKVKIFLENFLMEILNYAEQTNVWAEKAKLIGNDPVKFDKYFDDFTFI